MSPTPDTTSRAGAVAATFVELADSLVSDYDVIDVFSHLVEVCVSVFEVEAAGMLLDDLSGGLVVAAASNEDLRLLDLFQTEHLEGPCHDCVVEGKPVSSLDLREERRWPEFTRRALDCGFRSIAALPLRHHDHRVGSLGLFRPEPGAIAEEDLALAQALADVATIGLLQQRAASRYTLLAEQLRSALDSRVVIEQAKGVLAEKQQVSMQEAFARLRLHARNHNLKLTDVCLAVVEGRLEVPAPR